MAKTPLPIELQLTISSAKDLKNVNWRHGHLNPYAVVWVDPKYKFSTKVAAAAAANDENHSCPTWEETLILPLPSPTVDEDTTLFIDIVHAYAAQDTKPLIGSARISIKEIVDDVGFDRWSHRSLKLKRPSGRPQGELQLKFLVRDPNEYYTPLPPPPAASQPSTYRYPYPYASAPAGYPYAQSGYGYGGGGGGARERRGGSSNFGVGTGLAVGAVAGALGGLALAEGIDYVEDKVADDVEGKVLDDLRYGNDDFTDAAEFGGDDF